MSNTDENQQDVILEGKAINSKNGDEQFKTNGCAINYNVETMVETLFQIQEEMTEETNNCIDTTKKHVIPDKRLGPRVYNKESNLIQTSTTNKHYSTSQTSNKLLNSNEMKFLVHCNEEIIIDTDNRKSENVETDKSKYLVDHHVVEHDNLKSEIILKTVYNEMENTSTCLKTNETLHVNDIENTVETNIDESIVKCEKKNDHNHAVDYSRETSRDINNAEQHVTNKHTDLDMCNNKRQNDSDILIYNAEKYVETHKDTVDSNVVDEGDSNTKTCYLSVPVVGLQSGTNIETDVIYPSIIKIRNAESSYRKKLRVHFEDAEPTDEKEKFLRIVFIMLSTMLSFTIATIVTSMTSNHVAEFWYTNEGHQAFVFSAIIAVTLSGTALCPDVMRSSATSIIILIMTIASYSVLSGCLTVKWNTKFFLYGYTSNAVLILLCLLLTTKSFDFTGWALYWMAFATVTTVLTVCVIVELALFDPDITMYKTFVLYAGVLINCAFLVIILQIILGGTIIESRKDDYALSAHMLYTSTPGFFVQLFRLMCLVDLD